MTLTVHVSDGLTDASSVEEGKRMTVLADATDDVQVSYVMFYVDDVLMHTDASFPFTYTQLAPRRTASKTSLRVLARAVDTGGNIGNSTARTLTLQPDVTLPNILQTVPFQQDLYRGVVRITASGM